MNANLTEMREVTGKELRTVEGGWASNVIKLLRILLADEPTSEVDRFVATLTPAEKA